jgi:hypothetical protein
MDSNNLPTGADDSEEKISSTADGTKAFVVSARETMQQLSQLVKGVSRINRVDGDLIYVEGFGSFPRSEYSSLVSSLGGDAEITSVAEPKEDVLSQLEIKINQKLSSIDAHHAHIDSNREEIDYLGKQIDALLESM